MHLVWFGTYRTGQVLPCCMWLHMLPPFDTYPLKGKFIGCSCRNTLWKKQVILCIPSLPGPSQLYPAPLRLRRGHQPCPPMHVGSWTVLPLVPALVLVPPVICHYFSSTLPSMTHVPALQACAHTIHLYADLVGLRKEMAHAHKHHVQSIDNQSCTYAEPFCGGGTEKTLFAECNLL